MLVMMLAFVKEGSLCPPGANNEDVPVFIKFPSDPVVLVVGGGGRHEVGFFSWIPWTIR
jgi:hypothetical protein